MKNFNGLSPAEAERLALLVEELGEAQQAVGKILRHGYTSCHPDHGAMNKATLEKELGDVKYAVLLLVSAGDLSRRSIDRAVDEKRRSVRQWLHHQEHRK